MLLAAKMSSEDTPNWNEATGGENSMGYWEAMQLEYLSAGTEKETTVSAPIYDALDKYYSPVLLLMDKWIREMDSGDSGGN